MIACSSQRRDSAIRIEARGPDCAAPMTRTASRSVSMAGAGIMVRVAGTGRSAESPGTVAERLDDCLPRPRLDRSRVAVRRR